MTNSALAFSDGMISAVARLGYGFHFEEGGCYSMALALHYALSQRGQHAQLVYDETIGHAFVQIGGAFIDHQGTMVNPDLIATRNPQQHTPESLIRLAVGHGHSLFDVATDYVTASKAIYIANVLVQHPGFQTALVDGNRIEEVVTGILDPLPPELFDDRNFAFPYLN
jgi:hypothetical protein